MLVVGLGEVEFHILIGNKEEILALFVGVKGGVDGINARCTVSPGGKTYDLIGVITLGIVLILGGGVGLQMCIVAPFVDTVPEDRRNLLLDFILGNAGLHFDYGCHGNDIVQRNTHILGSDTH